MPQARARVYDVPQARARSVTGALSSSASPPSPSPLPPQARDRGPAAPPDGDRWLEAGAYTGRQTGPVPPPRDARWDEADNRRAEAKKALIQLLAPKDEWPEGPK